MSRIKQFFNWLRRVPLGVWFFLAATQAVTLVSAPREITRLEQEIKSMTGNPFYATEQRSFARIAAEKRSNVIAAICLLPIFVGFACLRAFSNEQPLFKFRDLFAASFTLRDMFAATFLIALAAGTVMGVGHSQLPPLLAIPFVVLGLGISTIGLIAIVVGAFERKAQIDDRSNR